MDRKDRIRKALQWVYTPSDAMASSALTIQRKWYSKVVADRRSRMRASERSCDAEPSTTQAHAPAPHARVRRALTARPPSPRERVNLWQATPPFDDTMLREVLERVVSMQVQWL